MKYSAYFLSQKMPNYDSPPNSKSQAFNLQHTMKANMVINITKYNFGEKGSA